MRRAGEVRVAGDRHDLRALGALLVQTLEVIHRPRVYRIGRLPLKHQHDVVDLEVVRERDDGMRCRAKGHRLVVKDPVADVLDAGLGQVVERVVRVGEPGTPPAARPVAGEFLDDADRPLDDLRLILDPVHRHVLVAVRGQLPAAFETGGHDLRVALADPRVDRYGRRHLQPVEHALKAPEADPHAVLVPRPVGYVGQQRRALWRADHRASHRPRDVPFLERQDRPEDETRAVRQRQRRALCNGRER